jgi:hypothetical protein
MGPEGMTWLQVWVGPPDRPPDEVVSNIRYTNALAGLHGGTHRVITDSEHLATLLPNSVYPWEACAEVHRGLREALDVVRTTNRPECLRSDIIRLWYAAHHENVLYVDTDCKVKSLPDIRRTDTWFARYGTEGIEHFMFYSDNKDVMSMLLGGILAYGYRHPKGLMFWDPHRLINEFANGKVKVIEPEHFTHG